MATLSHLVDVLLRDLRRVEVVVRQELSVLERVLVALVARAQLLVDYEVADAVRAAVLVRLPKPLVVFAGNEVREVLRAVVLEIPGLFVGGQQELLVHLERIVIQLAERMGRVALLGHHRIAVPIVAIRCFGEVPLQQPRRTRPLVVRRVPQHVDLLLGPVVGRDAHVARSVAVVLHL